VGYSTISQAWNGAWALSRGEMDAAGVTVETTPQRWARFLTARRGARRVTRDLRVGELAAIAEFVEAFDEELRR
jgi:hypothetical protein